MEKIIKVPTALISKSVLYGTLKMDGCTVIQQCIDSMVRSGTMFMQSHVLFLVLDGQTTFKHGKQTYVVRKNEMILLNKAISVQFDMVGDAENGNIYDGTMICIQDELLKEFFTTVNVHPPKIEEVVKTTVYPMDNRLIAFVQSLASYYNTPTTINPALLKLKITELLFNVAECSADAFRQILQLLKPIKADIRYVVEQNYNNPVTLSELAYLSGRSLSGFKREFQAVYNMPPAQWILGKRLEKAADMLRNTSMSVTDICFTLGFESPAHFSRAFKKQYGYSPVYYKLNNK